MVSTENRTSNPSRNQFGKRQQWPSQNQNPNPSMNRERMEGKGSYPGPLPAVVTAMVREGDRAASARGTEPRSALHPRSWQLGTTMRPLDGGVLSLGRARTPARGRWAEPLFFSLGHRGWLRCGCLSGLRCGCLSELRCTMREKGRERIP